MTKIALFGLGYTGQYLYETLESETVRVEAYSRNTQFRRSVLLNTEIKEEVQKLKVLWADTAPDFAIITFPPDRVHADFWTLLEEQVPNRLLLGTTGIYQGGGVITEVSPVLADHPRRQAEERFLDTGGTVLRLSGIYGPGRNPVSWLLKSKLAIPEKQLNLIHIRDIAAWVRLWLDRPLRGELFNLSDGQRHSWGKIAGFCGERGIDLPPGFQERVLNPEEDKFILPEKVWKTYPEMTFMDFLEYLENQAFGD
jgi:hypothetical protein